MSRVAGMETEYLCDTEVNLCYSSPCRHNGSCVRREGGYICQCIDAYTGKHHLDPVLYPVTSVAFLQFYPQACRHEHIHACIHIHTHIELVPNAFCYFLLVCLNVNILIKASSSVDESGPVMLKSVVCK